jgi:hypothetical protein
MESGMSLMPHDLEVYQVQPLPIVKAYADKMGLVEAINALVPTEMEVDPGTMVLGMAAQVVSTIAVDLSVSDHDAG